MMTINFKPDGQKTIVELQDHVNGLIVHAGSYQSDPLCPTPITRIRMPGTTPGNHGRLIIEDASGTTLIELKYSIVPRIPYSGPQKRLVNLIVSKPEMSSHNVEVTVLGTKMDHLI